jgi:hypothetical protein
MAITRVGEITFPAGSSSARGLSIDPVNRKLYCGTDNFPCKVKKIDLATFTLEDSLTLNAGENAGYCSVVDWRNNLLYVGCWTSPGIVVKIDLTTFTRVDAVNFGGVINQPNALLMDIVNPDIYICPTSGKHLGKLNYGTFTITGWLDFGVGDLAAYHACVDKLNAKVYISTYNNPARIRKISLPAMTEDARITLNAGEQAPRQMVVDPVGGWLFAGLYLVPMKSVRIRLSDFSRQGIVTFNANEDLCIGTGMAPGNDHIYHTHNVSPGGIVEWNESDGARVDSLDFLADDSGIYDAVWDSATGNAYIGTNRNPGRVIKLGGLPVVGSQHLPLMNIG